MKRRVLQRLSMGMAMIMTVSQMSGMVSFAMPEETIDEDEEIIGDIFEEESDDDEEIEIVELDIDDVYQEVEDENAILWADDFGFNGGDGTESNPYQIATIDQFNKIRENLDSNFILVDDIDLSSIDSWEPIGSWDEPFTGVIDGNGYVVSGMHINNETLNQLEVFQFPGNTVLKYKSIGLFASLENNACIKNFRVVGIDVDVQSNDYSLLFGGISGNVGNDETDQNTIINNCEVSGIIQIKSNPENNNASDYLQHEIGGIVGRIAEASKGSEYSIVSECKNNANIYMETGISWLRCGGICGQANLVEFEDCINCGEIDISGKEEIRVGGIVADCYSDVFGCSNYGYISVKIDEAAYNGPSIGGISGYSANLIKECQNYGDICADYTGQRVWAYVGGICGQRSRFDNEEIVSCTNYCKNIYGSDNYSHRIIGFDPNDCLKDNYSIVDTLVNDQIVTTQIGSDECNGENINLPPISIPLDQFVIYVLDTETYEVVKKAKIYIDGKEHDVNEEGYLFISVDSQDVDNHSFYAAIDGYDITPCQTACIKGGGSLVIYLNRKIVDSGLCGNNCKWTLNDKGTLIILPEEADSHGSICDFNDTEVPWEKDNIVNIIIQDGITSIGREAFKECKNLKTAQIAESVTKVYNEAFANCPNLVHVSMPKYNCDVYEKVFENCKSLESIDGTVDIRNTCQSVFSGCEKLVKFEAVYFYGYIPEYTFANCISKQTFKFPNIMITAEPYSFYRNSSLQYVWIPYDVTIKENAFYLCNNITDVYYSGSKEGWEEAVNSGRIAAKGNESIVQANIHYNSATGPVPIGTIDVAKDQYKICLADKLTYEIVKDSKIYVDNIEYTPDENGYVTLTVDEQDNKEHSIYASADGYCMEPYQMVKIEGGKYLIIYQEKMNSSESEETEGVDLSGFDPFIYQADYMLSDYDFLKEYNNIINEKTQCEKIANNIDDGDSAVIELWKNGMGMEWVKDPKSGIEYSLTQEDIYFGMIIDIIKESEVENAYDTYSSIIGPMDSVRKEISSTKTNIEMSSQIRELTKQDINDIEELVKKALSGEKSVPDKLFDGISDIIEGGATVNDALEMISNAVVLCSLHEESKSALREMKSYVDSTSDNKYLIGAFDRAIRYMDDDIWDTTSKIIGRYGAEYAVEKVWDKALKKLQKSNPALKAFLISYKTSKWVMNTTLNTDKIATSEIECAILYELLEAFDAASIRRMEEYQNNRSQYNAQVLVATMKMMFQAHLIDKDKAIALFESIDNEPEWYDASLFSISRSLTKAICPELSCKKQIENLKHDKNDLYSSMQYALIGWIENLPKTHPNTGLYEYYEREFKEAEERIQNHVYLFACPVDVEITSPSGTSYVKDGIMHAENDVVIVLDGDRKTVYLTKDATYQINLVGTGSGTMTAEALHFEDKDLVLDRAYTNVPLSEGTKYSIDASGAGENAEKLLQENGSEASDYCTEYAPKHTITIENGYIEKNGDLFRTLELSENETVTLVAFVPYGYQFTGWKVDGGANISDGSVAVTTITVGESDATITAEYKEAFVTHKINASADKGGSIILMGDLIIKDGVSQQFMICSDEGYIVRDVIVDGKSVGEVSEYTFTNVQKDHTIKATFIEASSSGGDSSSKEVLGNTFSIDQAKAGVSVIDGSHTLKLEINEEKGNFVSAVITDEKGDVDVSIDSYLVNIVTEYESDGKTPKIFYTLVFTDGKWDTKYDSGEKGAYEYKGIEYFIAGGVVNQNANGLIYTGAAGWRFLAAGHVVTDNEGLVMYNDEWFWIDKNGKCDDTYAAIVKWNGADFLVHGGRLRTDYSGFTYDPQSPKVWYHITNGQVWGDGDITDQSIEGGEITCHVENGFVIQQ